LNFFLRNFFLSFFVRTFGIFLLLLMSSSQIVRYQSQTKIKVTKLSRVPPANTLSNVSFFLMSEKSASKRRLIDIWKKGFQEMKQNWKKYFQSKKAQHINQADGDTLRSCSGQAVAVSGQGHPYCECLQAVRFVRLHFVNINKLCASLAACARAMSHEIGAGQLYLKV